MKIKKSWLIIIIFLVFWILFIAWGVVKTTSIRLPGQKSLSKASTPTKSSRLSTEKTSFEEIPKPLEQPEARPILVRALKVMPISFSDVLPVMGTVKGEREIELRFEINGVIKTIHFREGAKIKKGDLIVSLNPEDAQLKLEYAKSKLASSRAAYRSSLKKLEVQQKLYEAGAIIKARLEEIELECESAKFQSETIKAEQELAENELKKTSLYALMDALMGPREAEEGEFVTPQDKVGSLLETKNVLIEVGIVERDIHKIKLGQKAKVFVDAYPDTAFNGKIDNIFPIVEGRSRTLTAKIKVNNTKGLLLPGMFCRAEVVIIELSDALIIPSASLIITGSETMMVPVIPAESFKVNENEVKTGKVRLSRVTRGYATSDYVQIVEGLKVNDLVVIEARGELQDGSLVQITAIEEIGF
ncbi:MAG: efflux RND transporter periplasmic adaptor subunit [Candidatus Omnitrophota bacterium]|nr:efflux RND transporter periplasmic adaptor subunit [Candidatus Omnitrophota bacterium]